MDDQPGRSPPRYVAVEGPIGVGKTTLARMLAERWNARLVLEEFEDNPFLREFYDDPKRVAFQTQAYFLVARYKQQELLRQQELFARALVSDYLFAKDRIFAFMNLNEPELQLYEKIYELLQPRLLKPDLTVFLQARPEVLRKRMRKRGRDFERSLRMDYLENLMRAYNQFFYHYDETPLVIFETSDIDFAENPRDFENLLERIGTISEGRHEFVQQPA